jgi:hypothetical protein
LSTILKALRRLEEEKAASEEARPLREQIASEPRITTRPRRTGWAAAAIALVLGVAAGGGVIWWLFGRTAEPIPIAAAPAPAPSAPAAPAPAPMVAAVDPGLPGQAFESDVEIVDRPDAAPRIPDGNPIEPSIPDPKPGSVRPVMSSTAAERARQAALAEYNAAERARRGLPPAPIPAAPPTPPEPIGAAAESPSRAPDVAQAAPTAPAPVATPAPAATGVPIAAASPAPEAPAPAPAPLASPSPKPAPVKVAKPAPPREAPAPAPPRRRRSPCRSSGRSGTRSPIAGSPG